MYIHPYERLTGLSNVFYIKGYEVNWDFKLSASFDEIKYKGIIQDHHGQTMNHGKKRIRKVNHRRSIEPFINEIIENSHIEVMNRYFKIISDDLIMAQRLHSYSVWSLYKGSLINTQNKSFWIPKSQGEYTLYF